MIFASFLKKCNPGVGTALVESWWSERIILVTRDSMCSKARASDVVNGLDRTGIAASNLLSLSGSRLAGSACFRLSGSGLAGSAGFRAT